MKAPTTSRRDSTTDSTHKTTGHHGGHGERRYPQASYFTLPVGEAAAPQPSPAQPGTTTPATPETPGTAPATEAPRARVSLAQMPNPTDVVAAPASDADAVFTTFSPTAASSAPASLYSTDVPYLSAASVPPGTGTTAAHVPPSVMRSGVRYVDGGSASPRFVRMTHTVVPADFARASEVGVPLAAVLTPLADVPDDSEAVPLVDAGAEGPLRCTRCRAYMTPYNAFGAGGNEFTCALCGRRTDVPPWYFAPLDAAGARTDAATRPELTRGSAEYALRNPAYLTEGRAPRRPCVCFVLDASAAALRSGALPVAVAALQQALRQGLVREEVAVVTYDARVHYWDFSAAHGAARMPQMLLYADTAAMGAPFVPGVFADVRDDEEKRSMVESFLENLVPLVQQELQEQQEQQAAMAQASGAAPTSKTPALGAALQGACLLFKQMGRCGRVVLFNASFPTAAPGALVPRAAKSSEQDLLRPQTDFYGRLARTYAECRVGCDVFLLGAGQDVVTLGELARGTGGQAYVHGGFDAARDSWAVQAAVARNVSRVWGYDGALRVRCSSGLGVREYDGHASALSTDVDADLPVVTADTTLAAVLQHDDRLADGACAVVQAALLYTTRDGARRVRVHNVAVRVARDHAPIYKGLDCDAVVATLARVGARLVHEGSTLATTTGFLSDMLTTALATYRARCCTRPSPSQLILPEAVRLLPMYLLAMLKQPLFRHSAAPDARAAALLQAAHEPVLATLLRLYPKCYRLSAVRAAAADPDAAASGAAGPTAVPVRLGAEFLADDDVYLVDTGAQLVVWVRGAPAPDLLAACFGAEAAASLPALAAPQVAQAFAAQLAVADPPSPFAELVGTLALTRLHNNFSFAAVLPGESPDRYFMWNTEDEESGVISYMKYLCHIHRRVMAKIADDSTAAAAIAYAHRH